jgi:hypothetical protein
LLLQGCLADFTRREILDDGYFCPRCKSKRAATKELTLYRLPLIMVLHLKRFAATDSGGDGCGFMEGWPTHSKNTIAVDMPLQVQVPAWKALSGTLRSAVLDRSCHGFAAVHQGITQMTILYLHEARPRMLMASKVWILWHCRDWSLAPSMSRTMPLGACCTT